MSQLTNPVRQVKVNTQVVDQFPVYDSDGYTKISGLNPATQMTTTVYLDGAVVGSPPTVTITEIGSSGEYKLTFTPNQLGFWQLEVNVPSETQIWKADYDVSNPQALPGEVFYDRVTDLFGNSLPYVTVEVFAAGTATLLYTVKTTYDGQYSIPLSGSLSTPQLVDIRFSGGGLQTFTKTNVRLT